MNLWPVEHFCPPFFSRSVLISADLEKNGGQKCSTGQRFIFTEATFYKIHILVVDIQIWVYILNTDITRKIYFSTWHFFSL